MYSAAELNNLTIKPKINDITLEVLREFYEMFLYPFIFTYTVTSNDISQKINLAFNTRNFCHLLGVESIAKRSVKYSDLHNYRGEDGWNNIKNGLIDIKHLKLLNKKQFNNVKAKYVYFYLIPSLLENPLAVNYDKSKVKPPTNIDCELLFSRKNLSKKRIPNHLDIIIQNIWLIFYFKFNKSGSQAVWPGILPLYLY